MKTNEKKSINCLQSKSSFDSLMKKNSPIPLKKNSVLACINNKINSSVVDLAAIQGSKSFLNLP